MIRFIIETRISRCDTSGNHYHTVKITSTKTGKSIHTLSTWGSDGENVKAVLFNLGVDRAELYCVDIPNIPKRVYQRIEALVGGKIYERDITLEAIKELEQEK